MKKSIHLTVLAAVAAVLLTSPVLPASANSALDTDRSALGTARSVAVQTTAEPMKIGGFDVAIAEANGYKIVVDADGNMSSVPVTPEAVAERVAAEQALADAVSQGGVQSRSEMNMGTCGKVWVSATKGKKDMVTGKIGFSTFQNVKKFNWTLVVSSVLGGWVQTWNGGSVGTSWQGSNTAAAAGPGYATPRLSQADGYVVLSDGTKCKLGTIPGPTAWFG